MIEMSAIFSKGCDEGHICRRKRSRQDYPKIAQRWFQYNIVAIRFRAMVTGAGPIHRETPLGVESFGSTGDLGKRGGWKSGWFYA